MTSVLKDIQFSSAPALSYDADSELLVSDTEDGEVEVIEPTSAPSGGVPALASPELVSEVTLPARLGPEIESSSGLDSEPAPHAELGSALESSSGLVGEATFPARKVSGELESATSSALENGKESTHGLENEVKSPTRQVPGVLEPASSGLKSPSGLVELSPGLESGVTSTGALELSGIFRNSVDANVIILDKEDIRTSSTNFQCAVCEELFTSSEDVNAHFESHGNSETAVHFMKELYSLKTFWQDKFDKQQQELSSVQHRLNILQKRSPPPALSSPPSQAPTPFPAPAPASPPVSASPPAAPVTSCAPPAGGQTPIFQPAPIPKGKRKILYIRDSIHRAVVGPKLENPTGSLMRSVNAYASVRDERAPANKQHLNVSEVVRKELAKTKGEDTLVLGAPSVDISNQDTTKGIMEQNVIETIASSIAMVESAEYALKTGKVNQVILTEHIPRYDTEEKDKHKPELARLANKELHKARDSSEYAKNILVGQHTGLDYDGRMRINRFTSDHTNGLHGRHIRMGKYDGIHMYSQSGAEALTSSILSIFQRAGMMKQKRKTSPPSNQGAGQDWVTSQPTRGGRINNRSPRVEVPVWEIPTSNRFSGFC